MWIRILALLTLALVVDAPSGATEPPLPPRLPRDFQWEGRYIVRDLGVDVPFTWHGRDGNLQMIAGGAPADPIHFTNVLFDGWLYTLTYRWPDTVEPPPDPKCVCLGRLTLDTLNACLATSRYVGTEILRDERLNVHHFRVSVVLGEPGLKPDAFRLPIMQGDFYVDRGDSSKLWKVLHYGLQNLLDPALDEWIVMHRFRETAGEVALPAGCAGTCKHSLFDLPLFCR